MSADLSSLVHNVAADPLYARAVHFVMRTQNAGVLHVSRELRCGLGRTVELIDQMARDGAVSYWQPDGGRAVLLTELPVTINHATKENV